MFSKLDFCEVCNLSKKKCICNKVKCECCQKSFSNKSNLKAHLRNKDVCDKCGITKGKCKCNKVQCTCCDKTFANKNTLTIHQKNKIDSLDIAGDKEVHKCHKCHNTFDSKHSLGVHISNDHKQDLSCSLCTYKASQKINLSRHIKTVHSTEKPDKKQWKRDSPCEYCL